MWLCNKQPIVISFLVCFVIEFSAAKDESWLVYASNQASSNEIVVRTLSNNGKREIHIPVRDFVSALTFDIQEKKIYWSTRQKGSSPSRIYRVNTDGTSTEHVITIPDVKFITGLALDWITKNIYIVLELDSQIRACDLRRQLCAVLFDDLNYQPFRIALHPQSGTMLWTNRFFLPSISKASMDGSSPTKITAELRATPGSIAIDHALSRLYWVDKFRETVQILNLDGSNMSNLKSIGNTSIRAQSLAVTGTDIYWFDANDDSIKKCNKNDGSLLDVEKTGLRLSYYGVFQFDMFLMGSGSQPNLRVNHCANHSCPHICVLTETSYRCMCPSGLTLSKDGQHCEDVGPKMVISTDGGTHVFSIKTRELTRISNSSPSWGVTYDFQNSKIYWAGGKNGSTIFRSNVNGSECETVVSISGGNKITGLAYDWITHNIYYTSGHHVGVCQRSGKNCAVLLHSFEHSMNRIALFPHSGLMFWNAYGRLFSSITRAYMDGSSSTSRTISPVPNKTTTLVIDNQNFELHRLSRSTYITTSNLEVEILRSCTPKLENLKSIAVDGDLFYWINNKTIQSSRKWACSSPRSLKEFSWTETVFDMCILHREGQLQDRINHCAGGLCSHICVLTEKYFRCICPNGMDLMNDSRTCAEFARHEDYYNSPADAVSSYTPIVFKPEDDNGGRLGFRGSLEQWICANGMSVDLTDLCNGTLGCPDGTDEGLYCEIPCSKIKSTDDGKDCLRTPNGPQILCPQGFQLDADGATCEDVNECLKSVCENHCINTNGSFECRDLPENTIFSESEVAVTDLLGVALAAAIPTIVAIVLIGIAIFFGVKYFHTRKILRKLTPDEVQEFLNGDENAAKTADSGVDKAMLMPFRLVIQPESIIIAKDAILGSGQFGVVYRGFYGAEAVAIKTFKRTVEIDEFKAVLAEAKIMAYIGDHANVVKFIGADVSAIADRKLVLVTELSPLGDLLGHLRKIEPSKWVESNGESNRCNVTPKNLVEWCEQIACGMQYLEQVQIVHGDLAARNVLVFKDNVVKITDFGLSKRLYGNSEYMMKRQRMLPWKWSALELLTRREFSTDSDIWAFGVTAWEIFSLGRQPYDQLAIGGEFIAYLEQGNRLPKPSYATNEIYEILKSCWNVERTARPRFDMLREFFQEESTKAGINNNVKNSMTSRVDYGYTRV